MENSSIWGTVAVVVMLAVSVALLGRYLSVNVLNPSGKGAHRKTTRILNKFGLIRGFKTLSDIPLTLDDKTAYIENILVGYFGILLVHTCGARGEYYGTVDGESWILSQEEGRNRTNFPNPLLEQQKTVALLRALFAKHKLYNIPIEHIVYITSRAKKTGVFITHSGEILMPGKLSSYLAKTKFEKDTGLDVQTVVDVVTAATAPNQ